MSVTVSQHKNFVGGEWVDAVDGGTMEVLNPATGETIAEVPRGTQADVDRAVEAAKDALPEWLETTPGERAEVLLKLADALEENAEELAQIESQNVGKPLSVARDEMPVSADNIRFFAGAARVLEGKSRRRVHARLHLDDPPRAARDRRRDRALELPADDGGLEARARARRRQRPGAEALRADAADDAALRRARRGRSCRRASST